MYKAILISGSCVERTELLNTLASQGWRLITVSDSIAYLYQKEIQQVAPKAEESAAMNSPAPVETLAARSVNRPPQHQFKRR